MGICGQSNSSSLRCLSGRNVRERSPQEQNFSLELQIQAEREQLLAAMALRIRQSLNPSDILEATVSEVRRFLEVERAIVYRFNADWSGVVVAESASEHLPSLRGRRIQDHCFAQDWTSRYINGRVQATPDIHTAEDLSPCHIALLTSLNVRANLVVPIILETQESGSSLDRAFRIEQQTEPTKRLWGLLSVQQASTPHQWQIAEIDIVEKLAVQVAIALQQAKLYTDAQAEIIRRQQAEAKVLRIKARLEEQVYQQTAQLEATNRELKREIVEREQLEADLFREKELAQITLESIGDAVITTDLTGNVQYLNPVAEKLLGWSKAEIKGQAFTDIFQIVHEQTRQPVINPVEQVLKENKICYLADHTVLISRDGTEYGIDDSAAPIRDRNGQLIGAVVVFHDATQSRQLTQKLSWQASHDPLTGLVNRRAFKQRVTHLLATQANQEHALFYLDLDQFKVVNDTCGHSAGDQLLRQITRVMQQRVRSTDTLARLGGDEFGLLLEGCSLKQATALAESLRAMIEAFRFNWEDKTFNVGVSIGVVGIDHNNQNLATILSAADAACYMAKSKGRNRVHVCQRHDVELAEQRGQMQWVSRLHQALEQNHFRLYAQEIVPLHHSSLAHHCEILLRLSDVQGDVITPVAFLPAAERYDLMPAIDRWVVHNFCVQYQQMAQKRTSSASPALYNINLSGASIKNDSFLSFIKAQLLRYQVPPEQICFEITETIAISNLKQAVEFMQDLKQFGCRFALDDFGSGMSSLTYLKTLPVDYLKIDGSFVKKLASNQTDVAIVECFNHLSHRLGIQTIAECVEDQQTIKQLKLIGIDFAQGYSIVKPHLL
ncbi:Cyclic di-GMP phosphodiesterase PdeB [Acaryochloris thomasi RCC1774]|uniref:Cyclic di-GMP phosphodiesterase PdeB n=1 Tax=Acaryochloris thomasi RCC1774 TaxID=1764569 RepID=A0A2W1JLD6_9CYAN|nr:EAL domain-containing protein [Acaryochloris thomasi]PZD71722.1 Cyclic di-GMP phosphodiesterase PdeB [Acaryochloris thomasi RCC1774]